MEQLGDAKVIPVFRRFVRLRERLVPYLAEQGERSLVLGKPLMRALFFEVDDDPRIWDFPEQYFLGDDLLVAPVTEPGAHTARVYLPAGDWFDAWTGETLTGPEIIVSKAPLDRIPAFVAAHRAESLVPLFRDPDRASSTPLSAEPLEVG